MVVELWVGGGGTVDAMMGGVAEGVPVELHADVTASAAPAANSKQKILFTCTDLRLLNKVTPVVRHTIYIELL